MRKPEDAIPVLDFGQPLESLPHKHHQDSPVCTSPRCCRQLGSGRPADYGRPYKEERK